MLTVIQKGSHRRREREKGEENVFEDIIAENFLNMGNRKQVQEIQRVPGRRNPKRSMPRHIVSKLTKIKDKEKIRKTIRKKKKIT